MTKPDVVVISAGTGAEVLVSYLDSFSNFNVVAFSVDRDRMPDGDVMGRPVIPWEDLEKFLPPDKVSLIGPPSYAGVNSYRRDRYNQGKARGYDFASFIHPGSNVMTDDIGDHVIIMDQCIIQHGTRIGNNVIMWSQSMIAHHCVIKDHVFMSSQVGIAGNTTVGEETYLAGQVGVMNGVTIGARCAILNQCGIGRDIPDEAVVVGAASVIKPYTSKRIRRLL